MKMNDSDFSKMFIEMYSDIKALKASSEDNQKCQEDMKKDVEDLKSFKNKMLAMGAILSVIAGLLGDWIKNKFFS